jgi:hypothetical protein
MRQAEPYLQTWWDWRAAGNFMFGGTGSGLIFFAPFAALLASFVTPVLLAGLAFMALGLGLVWMEIGRRLRAMNVFRHPNPPQSVLDDPRILCRRADLRGRRRNAGPDPFR